MRVCGITAKTQNDRYLFLISELTSMRNIYYALFVLFVLFLAGCTVQKSKSLGCCALVNTACNPLAPPAVYEECKLAPPP